MSFTRRDALFIYLQCRQGKGWRCRCIEMRATTSPTPKWFPKLLPKVVPKTVTQSGTLVKCYLKATCARQGYKNMFPKWEPFLVPKTRTHYTQMRSRASAREPQTTRAHAFNPVANLCSQRVTHNIMARSYAPARGLQKIHQMKLKTCARREPSFEHKLLPDPPQNCYRERLH